MVGKRFWQSAQVLLVLWLGVILSGGCAWGQTLEVSAPQQVYAGQQFRVVFSTSGKLESLTPPDFAKLDVLAGPQTSRMQQVQVINGKVDQRVTTSYIYVCSAPEEGTYTIPPVEAKIGGETVKSQAWTIEALAATSNAQPTQGRRPGQGRQPQSRGSEGDVVSDKDLFVRVIVDRTNVYKGEPILATVKLYTRVDVAGFEDLRFPEFNGFWAKEIETAKQISFTQEAYKGREYHVATLRKYALYPQKAGTLEIDPLEASIVYRVHRRAQSIWDEFMGGGYREDVHKVQSAKIKINVKDLPSNAPQGFGGAVGQFTANAQVDKQEVLTNEAVTFTYTITGSGNMQLIPAPDFTFPNTVEAFPPKEKANYRLKGVTQSGSITYEYVLIPRAPGQIKIPEFTFGYFDPSAKQYKVCITEPISLDITADSTQLAGPIAAGNISKEDVKYIGEDIRYIHSAVPVFYVLGDSLIGGVFWWLFIFLLVLAVGITWILLARRLKLQADVARAKGRQARSLARKRLRKAKGYMEESDQRFYEELVRAIWGYLSDKLGMNMADLSSSSVREQLEARGVDEQTEEELSALIADCEYARYAPDAGDTQRSDLYARALRALEAVDASLKQKGRKA